MASAATSGDSGGSAAGSPATSVPFDALASLRTLASQAGYPAAAAPSSGSGDAAVLTGLELAKHLDQVDALASFRDEFHIPNAALDEHATDKERGKGDSIYLCGNSLGLQPKRTSRYMTEELDKWKAVGVEGHFQGKRPWAKIDEFVTGMMAEVVGAESSDEVVVMNSLSVNLHLLLVSFYRPTEKRFKILIENNAFCSDYHVIKSQVCCGVFCCVLPHTFSPLALAPVVAPSFIPSCSVILPCVMMPCPRASTSLPSCNCTATTRTRRSWS